MINTIKTALLFLFASLFFTACDEDFDLTTEYKDQTVIYAFLEHKDPWHLTGDTNFIVVNKAFLGEKNVYEMAAVSDSVNYDNYDEINVTLQRISNIDPNSQPIGEPIVCEYTTHYKDSGAFSRAHNVVFYTTKNLMLYKDVNLNPSPDENDSYFYKISVKKPGKEEVYATTKIIRGMYEGRPLNLPENNRLIEMASTFPNYTYNVEFGSNIDARIYQFKIRTYFYEKRTDGNIYIDYIDYLHPLMVTRNKIQQQSEDMEVNVTPSAYYTSFNKKLKDTTGVVWRIIKTKKTDERPETHSLHFTLGSQETYIYNQITQPSNGIVQEKPTYTNITNGLGLFTSKWNYSRNNFTITGGTIDSLSVGIYTKDLKFRTRDFTYNQNEIMDHTSVIKRY